MQDTLKFQSHMTPTTTRQRTAMLARMLAGLSLAAGMAGVSHAATGTTASSETAACADGQAVRFGGMNWESNLLLVEIERRIVETGYGCRTSVEPGETIPMLAALERGDVDVNSEIWPNQTQHAWNKALASGKVIGVGHVFTSAEGWYIPRYTAERFPDVKTPQDLLRHASAFADPEDPSRSVIYGCPVGWVCETLNQNLLQALGMAPKFSILSPGNGASLKAAIQSNYRRKRDIAFYYWSPTPLEGALDLVKLELPPFDEAAFTCLTKQGCASPKASDFQTNEVMTGLNKAFAEKSPALATFFTNVSIPREVISASLAEMEQEGLDYATAAQRFLEQHGQYWKQWVPADVSAKVAAAL